MSRGRARADDPTRRGGTSCSFRLPCRRYFSHARQSFSPVCPPLHRVLLSALSTVLQIHRLITVTQTGDQHLNPLAPEDIGEPLQQLPDTNSVPLEL